MQQFLLPWIRDIMMSMSCISRKRCKCLAKTGIPVSLQYGSMIVNIFALYDLLRNNSFMKFKPTVWRSLYVASCSSLQGGEAITATKSAEEIAELYQNTGSLVSVLGMLFMSSRTSTLQFCSRNCAKDITTCIWTLCSGWCSRRILWRLLVRNSAASNLPTYFLLSRNPIITNKSTKTYTENPESSAATRPLWVLFVSAWVRDM